jgi:hypothetical protein
LEPVVQIHHQELLLVQTGHQLKLKELVNHLFFLQLLLPVVEVVVNMIKMLVLKEDQAAEEDQAAHQVLVATEDKEIFLQSLLP